MKYRYAIVLFLLSISCVHHFSAFSQDVFYVSLAGNDAWSGKRADPDKANTDGPFKTFNQATLAIEALNEQGKITDKGIVVFIRGGVYAITETITLTQKMTGKNGYPIIWKGYKDEKIQLVGGKEIKGFHAVTDKVALERINKNYRQQILQINLKDLGITNFGTITNRGKPGAELFFNNKKMELARWPNKGWAKIADVPQTGNLINKGELPHMRFGLPVGRHYGRFTYEGNRPNNWSDIKNISLHGYWVWDWFDEFLNIQSIDTLTKEIFIKTPHSSYGYCKEQRFYALNVLEELDQPGEWYIDRSSGVLFFWPPQPIEQSKVFISLLDQPLMLLDNTANVHIENMAFEFSQGNGIVIKNGEHNLIAGCSFNNLGEVAVRMEGGIKNGLSGCDIYNLAVGGVELSGGDRKTLTPAGNYVVNNHIHDFAQWIRTYQPGIVISGVGNYIAHNLIHNGPGTGILLTGNEHILEYNELHHLALETGDVGAFYMGRDWTERGNIIRYNYFHDLKGGGVNDVNAVYLDDWASGTTVSDNIFSDCARGIMIGGGRDNTIDNNIFIDCHPAVHVDARGLGWAKYYFDGTDKTLFNRMDAMNYKLPPYSEKYPALLSLYNDEPAIAKNNKIIHNISYGGRWIDLQDGLDLKTVLSADNLIGKPDKGYKNEKDHIVTNNPGIYNLLHKDFRVKPNGFKYGFKQIPYNKIGLQKDAYRKNPIRSFIVK